MDVSELNEFIKGKESRYLILEERKSKLNSYKTNIRISKIKSFFGTGYIYIQSILSLFFGFVFVFLSLALLIYPDMAINKLGLIKKQENTYISSFDKISGLEFNVVVSKLNTIESDINNDLFIHYLNESVRVNSVDENAYFIRVFSIFIFSLGLFFLYLAWTIKKKRLRKNELDKDKNIKDQIINDYKFTIDEEMAELKILKKIQKMLNSEI